jgi:hypothetical protein
LKLQSFDAAAKPKIIREVKALIPNLTLIDVSSRTFLDGILILTLGVRRRSLSSLYRKSSRKICPKKMLRN